MRKTIRNLFVATAAFIVLHTSPSAAMAKAKHQNTRSQDRIVHVERARKAAKPDYSNPDPKGPFTRFLHGEYVDTRSERFGDMRYMERNGLLPFEYYLEHPAYLNAKQRAAMQRQIEASKAENVVVIPVGQQAGAVDSKASGPAPQAQDQSQIQPQTKTMPEAPKASKADDQRQEQAQQQQTVSVKSQSQTESAQVGKQRQEQTQTQTQKVEQKAETSGASVPKADPASSKRTWELHPRAGVMFKNLLEENNRVSPAEAEELSRALNRVYAKSNHFHPRDTITLNTDKDGKVASVSLSVEGGEVEVTLTPGSVVRKRRKLVQTFNGSVKNVPIVYEKEGRVFTIKHHGSFMKDGCDAGIPAAALMAGPIYMRGVVDFEHLPEGSKVSMLYEKRVANEGHKVASKGRVSLITIDYPDGRPMSVAFFDPTTAGYWDYQGNRTMPIELSSPVADSWITSPYGRRWDPRRTDRHPGVDLHAKDRAEIMAAGDGVVVYAGELSGYGSHVVIIQHGYDLKGQPVYSLYGHMCDMSVKKGQIVKQKQLVGHSGCEGLSEAEHLHFEIRVGGDGIHKGGACRDDNPLVWVADLGGSRAAKTILAAKASGKKLIDLRNEAIKAITTMQQKVAEDASSRERQLSLLKKASEALVKTKPVQSISETTASPAVRPQIGVEIVGGEARLVLAKRSPVNPLPFAKNTFAKTSVLAN